MSATKSTNGKHRKSKAPAADSSELVTTAVEDISPAIANRVKGKLPHPSTTGNSTPAGIAAHDPTAESFGHEPPKFEPLSGRTLERDYGGKTLSNVTLDKCVRHPDNRQPTDEAVAKMAASIEKEGLLDPLVVRGLAGGKWQIVSGETRYLALKKLGRKQCDAHVLHCDDARALELLAIYNAERTDLNCIEKARLIDRLCQPKEQGGGGLTREAAAKIYGLQTGAAASNLVALLRLPKVWQDRVMSGEFPQTFARLLVPYAGSAALMKAIDDDYRAAMKSEWARKDWLDRESVEEQIEGVIAENTALISGAKRNSWEVAALFKLTPELEQQLEIIDVTIDKMPTRLAVNTKLFYELQRPLLEAKEAKRKKAAVGATTKDRPEKRELTPAERKAKAKEQAKVLEQRIERWRHRWLRHLCAADIERQRCLDWQVLKVVLWLAAQPRWVTNSDEEALGLANALCAAIGNPAKPIRNEVWRRTRHEAWDAMHAKCQVKAGYHDHLTDLGNAARGMVIKMLRTEDVQPGRYLIPQAVVEGLAADLSIDLVNCWRLLQTCEERTELETFFELHTSGQLDDLAEEFGSQLGAGPKASKVRLLMAIPQRGQTLPLPKSIKPLPAPEAAAAGGRKKKGAK